MLKIKGLGKILVDIETLNRETFNVAKAELGNIASDIEEESLKNVHVDSGHLKSTAFTRETENGFAIGYSAPYAAFQEFGTGPLVDVPNGFEDFAMEFFVNGEGKGKPHPFLFPAFFMYGDGAVKRIEEALKKNIKILV